MFDSFIDRKLNIDTSGQDYSRKGLFNFGYDPTTYKALRKLADSGFVGEDDVLLDYGCGKGRVCFYLALKTRCRCIGIDSNENLLNTARINFDRAGKPEGVSFVLSDAGDYEIKDATCAYFFNPFSKEVFIKVLRRMDEYGKPMKLFLYYPSPEFKEILGKRENTRLIREIDCRDLQRNSPLLSRILVYEINNGPPED